MTVWLRILLFGAVGAIWIAADRLEGSPAWDFVFIIGGPLAVYPIVWRGRRLIDREPVPANARAVTAGVHAAIMALYGAAVIKALALFSDWHGWTIALPRPVTDALFLATTIAMSLTVANLAIDAFGAPFAVALSRRLASGGFYRRTRNPMALATIAWFVAIGLSLQSAAFVFWVVLVLTPAELEYLEVYEERELEIRFGNDYLAYRAKTPFLLPRLA